MSEEQLFNGILFVASVIAAVTLFVKVLTRDNRVKKVLREFASMKGLRPGAAKYPGDMLFEGENRGFPFVIERISRRGRAVAEAAPSGEHISLHTGAVTYTTTRMRLILSGLPLGLTVRGDESTRKAAGTARSQDIRTGDPEIDGSFIVKGRNPEEVVLFLSPERLRALKIYLKGREQLELRNNEVLYERKNDVTNISELSRIYKKMGEFAAAFGVPPVVNERAQ